MTVMTLGQAAALLQGELHCGKGQFQAVSIDTRTLKPGELFIALQGPHFDGHDFIAVARERGACAALVSHQVAIDLPQICVADTRLALGRLGQIWRECFTGPLIALTGSNGKTTVKEMIAAILRGKGEVLATLGNLNNDIGMPLTLLQLRKGHNYAVIEMGANHQGEIAYLTELARPDVALVTNAGPAHLEGFSDLDGVARGKGEIFQGLRQGGVAIINRDDPYADYWSRRARDYRIIDFGLDHPAQVGARLLDGAGNRFGLSVADQRVDIQLPLAGRHNVSNALAAAAACLAVGVGMEDIRRGLEGMHGVIGRLQRLPGPGGITIIDDTYNANPASLDAALEAAGAGPGSKWLALGDMAELGADAARLHGQAGQRARMAGFERLYALGEYSLEAARTFGTGGSHFQTVEALLQALLEASKENSSSAITVLVKGSRSMRMERIVRALVAGQCPPNREEHQ